MNSFKVPTSSFNQSGVWVCRDCGGGVTEASMAVTLVWSAAGERSGHSWPALWCLWCAGVGRVGPGLAGGSSQCGTGVLWIVGVFNSKAIYSTVAPWQQPGGSKAVGVPGEQKEPEL